MSEYQYYEWQTIDRPLTEREQSQVSKLSSHIEVGPSQAIVTYSWSDFKYDPQEVLAEYFDAFLYLANWGSRRLMFRFPNGSLDPDRLRPYFREDSITLETFGDSQILDIVLDEEEGFDWIEGEGVLSGLVSLRNDVLEGDYRLLCLAWLKAISLEDPEEVAGELEPPVPAGLRQLSPALTRFSDTFDLDDTLLKVAAAESPEPVAPVSEDEYRRALRELTRDECETYLFELASGERGVAARLRQRLLQLIDRPVVQAGSRRTVGELFREVKRRKAEARRRAAAEAERKRIQELKALAARETQTWQQVEALIEQKQAKSYNDAVILLQKLRDLAEYQGTQAAFQERVRELRGQYKNRPSLIKRFADAGLP